MKCVWVWALWGISFGGDNREETSGVDVELLCDMVKEALEEGKVENCVAGRLRCNFPAQEAIPVIKFGLICASQVPSIKKNYSESKF